MDKEALIVEIESWANACLPTRYRNFLLRHEEAIFGESVLIYPAECLIDRNETYETKLYCPGYITIGDDSGGNAFIISLAGTDSAVYIVSHGYMKPAGFDLVASDLMKWIEHGCPISDA